MGRSFLTIIRRKEQIGSQADHCNDANIGPKTVIGGAPALEAYLALLTQTNSGQAMAGHSPPLPPVPTPWL